jgi:sulfur carrier protein ThiS
MRVLYVNNDGGGFADYVEVAEGTTVNKFFSQKMAGGEPCDYLIRVNRQPVPRDYVLQEGDRITITPTKIEGANSPLGLGRAIRVTVIS